MPRAPLWCSERKNSDGSAARLSTETIRAALTSAGELCSPVVTAVRLSSSIWSPSSCAWGEPREDRDGEFAADLRQAGGEVGDPLLGGQGEGGLQRCQRSVEGARAEADDGEVGAGQRLAAEPVLLSRPGASLSWFTLGVAIGAGLAAGLLVGFTIPLTYGLTVSGSSWIRYHIMVAINAARRRGPLRFCKFLDWAVNAGLLRVSGVSYQFRHREMQDRLITTRSARP